MRRRVPGQSGSLCTRLLCTQRELGVCSSLLPRCAAAEVPICPVQVVRGLDWLDSPAGAVVTGSEDGQLCLWAAAVAAGGKVAAGESRATKRRK